MVKVLDKLDKVEYSLSKLPKVNHLQQEKLQKHILKLRGLGPFVINKISPNGAVTLENLNG